MRGCLEKEQRRFCHVSCDSRNFLYKVAECYALTKAIFLALGPQKLCLICCRQFKQKGRIREGGAPEDPSVLPILMIKSAVVLPFGCQRGRLMPSPPVLFR